MEVLEKYAAAELDLQMKDPSVAYSKILDLAWVRLSGQANLSFDRGGPAASFSHGRRGSDWSIQFSSHLIRLRSRFLDATNK